MDLMRLEQVSFTYPGLSTPALNQVSLTVASSQFIVICGPSGCGKTTFVRNLKREIAPHGQLTGQIYYRGQDISQPSSMVSAADIGFVMQDPDNQIVTDTVWHELAFGLENLGLPTSTIRRRVAETAHFFGINTCLFEKAPHMIPLGFAALDSAAQTNRFGDFEKFENGI